MSSLTGRVVRGALAGAVGTLAMDRLWYQRYRDGGGDEPFVSWERSRDTTSFEEAPAPAKLGKRVANMLGIEVPESAAGTVNDLVHWLTGVGYGALMQGLVIHDRRNPAASGLATGVAAWANAYVLMGALGLYEPIWEYDAETLKKDLSAHLVFGGATALTYRVLDVLTPSG